MLQKLRKTDIPSTLRPFVGHNFNYGTWDCECGPNKEARSFCRKLINFINKNVPHIESTLKANYYDVSGMIQRPDGQRIYVSFSDIRFWQDEWAEKILIRTMKHDKDWTGGPNHYTNIRDIAQDIARL